MLKVKEAICSQAKIFKRHWDLWVPDLGQMKGTWFSQSKAPVFSDQALPGVSNNFKLLKMLPMGLFYRTETDSSISPLLDLFIYLMQFATETL